MNQSKIHDFLIQNVSNLNGVGTKTKNLVDYIPLSLAAIEKRKRNIRKIFEIEESGDKPILDKAPDWKYGLTLRSKRW